jgi:hypothetical protein
MTVAKNDPWVKGSPYDQVEGSDIAIPYTIVFEDVDTVTVNDIKVFKDGNDVTATVMPSGNHNVSGNRLTMKPLTLLVYPGSYIIRMAVDVDGIDDAWKLEVRAISESQEQ